MEGSQRVAPHSTTPTEDRIKDSANERMLPFAVVEVDKESLTVVEAGEEPVTEGEVCASVAAAEAEEIYMAMPAGTARVKTIDTP